MKNEHGNALWFILLAVALLGFLTATISRTSNTTDQTGNVEQARLKASALLQYSKSIQTAVQNMRMRGVSENDLDFIAIDSGAYNNPNCSVAACEVFSMEGGGITYRDAKDVINISSYAQNWAVSTGNRVGGMGCDNATHRCRDLLLILQDLPESLCLQVNQLLDITNPSDAPPVQSDIEIGAPFTGSYNANTANELLGGSSAGQSPEVYAKEAGCVQDSSSTTYFYQVLAPR